nr:outer membrane protein assembly factor BamC [Cellvibrionaceae bacterium]
MKSLKCRSYLVFVIISSHLLSGCSTFFGDEGVFRSRQKDYLRAAPVSPMTVPGDKVTRPMVTIYDVPEINANDEFGDAYQLQDYEIPRPNPMADKGEVGVKIQKLGSERWIFLNASTSQVWPRTQNFMSEYNLQVVASNASAGLIETGWLRFKNDAETKTRYRVSLEKGIHPETSEIHILQMQRPESFPEEDTPVWP